MKKQIYVVEGKNDVSRLQQVFENINVISVGGSAIKSDVIKYLKSIENEYEIIICTDPDFPGEKIRKNLEEIFPKANHLFINKEEAHNKNKTKIGLEHMSDENIKSLFKNIYKKQQNSKQYQMDYLYEIGLVGHLNSKKLRQLVSERLNLGFTNGKTFLKRFNQSKYNLEDIVKIINEEQTDEA